MSLNKKIFSIIAAGLLAVLMIISFLVLNLGDEKVRRTLFFPGLTNNQLVGEVRFLPEGEDDLDNIRIFLSDLILGPVDIKHDRLFPLSTDINSLFYNDRVLLVDFSDDIVFFEKEVHLSFEEMLDGIDYNLRYNFKLIKDIKITVNGQEIASGIFNEFYIPQNVEN